MAGISRRNFALGALGVAGVVALDACSRTVGASTGRPGATLTPTSASPSPSPTPSLPAVIQFAPKPGAQNVNPAWPIQVSVANGTVQSVTMTSSDGAHVPGKVSPDGSVWTASEALGYGHTYTLAATAQNGDGIPTAKSAKFSTLSPSAQTTGTLSDRAGAPIVDGKDYGIGFVIRLTFDQPIVNKANAERALTVTTTPAVDGVWFWEDDQNVLFRPEKFYASGTKIVVDANLYGVELAPGLFGAGDSSNWFRIGRKQLAIANDNTHQVYVYFDDKLVRTMPTSMGRGGYTTGTSGQTISFYTPPGTYTVLDQSNPVLMTSASYGLPASYGAYSEYIPWATRISTDGIYLHELDTTVWAQGNTDTSHGCLNLNHDNAEWYYTTCQIGDPVIVEHTGGAGLAQWQNGDWSVPWKTWVAGSALHA